MNTGIPDMVIMHTLSQVVLHVASDSIVGNNQRFTIIIDNNTITVSPKKTTLVQFRFRSFRRFVENDTDGGYVPMKK